MSKVLALAVITGFVLAASSAADARGGGHGFGGFAGGGFSNPGHMFRQYRSYRNYPGASGWAPGRQMRMNGGPGYPYTDSYGNKTYYPGATYWRPGAPGFPTGLPTGN
jgi:hypothetical protein